MPIDDKHEVLCITRQTCHSTLHRKRVVGSWRCRSTRRPLARRILVQNQELAIMTELSSPPKRSDAVGHSHTVAREHGSRQVQQRVKCKLIYLGQSPPQKKNTGPGQVTSTRNGKYASRAAAPRKHHVERRNNPCETRQRTRRRKGYAADTPDPRSPLDKTGMTQMTHLTVTRADVDRHTLGSSLDY